VAVIKTLVLQQAIFGTAGTIRVKLINIENDNKMIWSFSNRISAKLF
jgi:hypothetical protein